MTLLIVLCWVLPILLIVATSGYSASQNTNHYLNDIVTVSVENAMGQITNELEGAINDAVNISYNDTIRNAYTSYQRTNNTYALVSSAKEALESQYRRNGRIRAAYLLLPQTEDNEDYRCFMFNPSNASYLDVHSFYASDIPQMATDMIPSLGSDITFLEQDGRLYLVRVLSLWGNRMVPYAALMLELDTVSLFAPVHSLLWVENATLRLEDALLPIVGDAPETEFSLPDPASDPEVKSLYDHGILQVTGGNQGERFQMQYSVRVDTTLLSQRRTTPLLVLILLLLTIPMIALVFAFFYRKVTRPIQTLEELSHKIEEGEFGRQVDTDLLTSAEFYELGNNLNAMSNRLEYQFERLYREELALRDARMKALQSQINPHFLGNTLEVINWEARMAGDVKVSRMLEALTTMLEAALDRKHRPLIHLSEEMMYVNSYLYIIGERLGKRLEVVQEIDPNLMDWYVPRLILQPILENAVEHGVSSRSRGKLIIRARQKDDDWIVLEVENNTPMTPEDQERVRVLLETDGELKGEYSGNIGIRNVHQRLQILYGPEAGLTVENTKNETTLSSICIQHLQKEQIETR